MVICPKKKSLKSLLKNYPTLCKTTNLSGNFWQAVLSRGDYKLTDFILDIYKNGFCLGAFKTAAKKYNINTDFYALENYPYECSLAWDFIDTKPGKMFLIKESRRLLSENGCIV